MARVLGKKDPLVLDVGANVGQSIRSFLSIFPGATIHSFEPSPAVFAALKENASRLRNVHLWNCALGSKTGELTLLENDMSEWTSFFPPSEFGWGRVKKQTRVHVATVDEFCHQNGIPHIDVLKSDTQGFELEVFKGAERMLAEGHIKCVYCELVFSDMYKNMPTFCEVFDFLMKKGFFLVSFYDIAYERDLASWTDGLFVHNGRL
jgi:FkbM family methyltransferase